MKRAWFLVAVLQLTGALAGAHRLDEYLQGTILSVEKYRVNAQITMTPGVAVSPMVIADMDADQDGIVSATEQRTYAARVLRDVALTIDGEPLNPRLLSLQFPEAKDMQEGRGEIQIEFEAELPPGGSHRKLRFENHHQSRISAYQVNCLVPRDPQIRIVGQDRNYSQSRYELNFDQEGLPTNRLSLAGFATIRMPLGVLVLLLSIRLAVLRRRRTSPEPRSR